MNYAHVARQPILDDRLRTVGFELLFRDGTANAFPASSPDRLTSNQLNEQLLQSDFLVQPNYPCYIKFSYQALTDLIPRLLPQENIVVQVSRDCSPDDKLLQAIRSLVKNGYTVALDDFVAHPDWKPFLPYVKLIKIDITTAPLARVERFINKFYMSGVKFIAVNVDDYFCFEQAQMAGFDYYQGAFFTKPEVLRKKKVEPAVATVAQLMTEVYKSEINYKTVERLFSNDVGLSFNLLRYANSANTVVSRIKSINQAIAYIGQERLKRFVAMIAVTAINQSKPDYLYVLSMQRAHFCQLVMHERYADKESSAAFLVGMFSLLDALLDQAMSDILNSTPLDEGIKRAIVSHEGEMGKVLSLVMAYEQAQWTESSRIATELRLGIEQVARLYNASVSWSDNIFSEYH